MDTPFGSLGSYAAFAPLRGSYEVNPPFVSHIIDDMSTRLLEQLHEAQSAGRALSFAVVLPGWTDNDGYQRLLSAGPLLRGTILLAATDHGFVDGGQHVRPRSHRGACTACSPRLTPGSRNIP